MKEASSLTGHVLLVDDRPEELRPLIRVLTREGFRLSVVAAARKAVYQAQLVRPDIIVLDLHMPDMDGLAVCRLLRESPVTQEIPVIFLSSSTSVDDRLAGLKWGAVDFVVKPYTAEEVLARLRIHLSLAWRAMGQESAEETSLQPVASADELVLRAASRLIFDDLANPPSLSDIAKASGTHEKRLLKVFREHFGMTVFAYIRHARLQRAKELLAEGLVSIEDIAALVGFSGSANFATAFKAQEGVTPRAYRQQARASEV
ncbi:DNA-binding response regulator [Marinobacter daepoensis]|uniref:DNA-binding response regulator n=1 Tax=Marinobacter daepoensis TaxID=262077 RepID=A0ABS3BFT9_9GAMM|nr:DNA-binding response regulator [Marinobacter daepoensis]MBN7769746.1 DNA-binding response regulator [Marinobacter daepoensis]MBY6078436.1 DNA-binding response regulator [Marinobacter daepoensis]